MDWVLDTSREDTTSVAVKAVEDHLQRHASDDSAVGVAVEAVHQVLPPSADHVLWLHLDWSRVLPTLTVRTLAAEEVEVPDSGFGPVSAMRRRELLAAVTGQARSVDLPVAREVSPSFDPDVATLVELEPFAQGSSCAAVALAAAAESHPVATADQVAAAAGAMLADAALRGGAPVATASDVVDAFGGLHEALGGAFGQVHAAGDRIELAVDRSPFGRAIAQLPSLARMTEAIAGRIAARVNGRAVVVHDETLGLGDPADRLQILLGEVDDGICGSTYLWPPAGTHATVAPSPRLEMSVALPRQSHSVPVIRRLGAQILRAFGVAADSIHDVELAISEACANVIQHAVDSDGYEVSIELAADRCSITVIDRGQGFEPSVAGQPLPDSESGRGLSLMHALVDNLNFVNEPKVGAVVHMVKHLDYEDGHLFRQRSAD